MKKNLSTIIFWGALWGLTEATLGHLLHLLPINIGWLIWMPLAFYFLHKVYTLTSEKTAVLYVAVLASAIKLLDLMAPVRIDYVINPAVSILLEGMIIYIACSIKNIKYDTAKITYVLLVNTGWRVLYIIYATLMPPFVKDFSPVSGIMPFIRFFIIENAVTAIIFTTYSVFRSKHIKREEGKFKFASGAVYSLLMLGIAVCVQIAI